MRLLNRIVTNPFAVWVSYVLCKLWNVLTLHTPSAKRRAAANRAAFDATPLRGRVQGQRRPPVAALPYGKFTMDYNGCEVIAAHNALLTLGIAEPLGEAAAYFERHGLFLGGAWGTHVLAVPGYFNKAHGCRAKVYWKDFDTALTAKAGARAAVFSYWNDKTDLMKGVHTVAITHGADGGLLIDNLYTAEPEPYAAYRSIAELIERTGILPILLVTAQRQ